MGWGNQSSEERTDFGQPSEYWEKVSAVVCYRFFGTILIQTCIGVTRNTFSKSERLKELFRRPTMCSSISHLCSSFSHLCTCNVMSTAGTEEPPKSRHCSVVWPIRSVAEIALLSWSRLLSLQILRPSTRNISTLEVVHFMRHSTMGSSPRRRGQQLQRYY